MEFSWEQLVSFVIFHIHLGKKFSSDSLACYLLFFGADDCQLFIVIIKRRRRKNFMSFVLLFYLREEKRRTLVLSLSSESVQRRRKTEIGEDFFQFFLFFFQGVLCLKHRKEARKFCFLELTFLFCTHAFVGLSLKEKISFFTSYIYLLTSPSEDFLCPDNKVTIFLIIN